MNGLLNVAKPPGPTSHDVVARARRILNTRRIGHAGTLDPMASGVLLLCVGVATRLVEYLSTLPKRYDAVAEFGVTTSTQDLTGAILDTRDAACLRSEEVEAALARYRGEILQTPPMVSAVKHEGRRLYALARAGEEVERAARSVTVYELELTEFSEGMRPRARLDVLCSSGTYVRTLIHDLGATLGTGAAMASLARTAIGRFTLADSLTLEELERLASEERIAERLIPPGEMVAHLPAAEVPDGEIPKLLHGGAVHGRWAAADTPATAVEPSTVRPVRLMASSGEVLAIGRWSPRDGEVRFVPTKVLMQADEAISRPDP
jgi:tRNA pseudouridine55 synthase